ncbi:MAG: TetR/AcrR family transcriptional regulator [Verrucomicrobiota bacterium]
MSASKGTHVLNIDIEDTRGQILVAAEKLFAENGFQATSLRSITNEARVNIASVNYHFGSKEKLILELLRQGIRPLNEERYRMLDAFEAEYDEKDETIPVEKILEALFRPAFQYFAHQERRYFLRVLGRCLTEEAEFISDIFENEWEPLCKKFEKTLHDTLPEMPDYNRFWRLHLAVGGLIHIFNPVTMGMIQDKPKAENDSEKLLQELICFSAAGFKAEIQS